MNIQRIEENEIPYEELGKFGLTQEMIDDLPEPIMNKYSIKSGCWVRKIFIRNYIHIA